MQLRPFDIHNHILPGVDDGFGNIDESLEAVRRLSDAGVKDITFTPHINPDVFPDNDEDMMREVFERFRSLVPAEVKCSLAAEYMICAGFEKGIANRADKMLCFSDRSILVEMSYYFRSKNLEEALFELQMSGFKPILAHPERYLYMAECLKDFDILRERGCRFQLNYISFTGVYGDESIKIIRYLAKKGYIDFVSTDLHSLNQFDRIIEGKTPLLLRKPFISYLIPEQKI